jgi:hypothetical protein
MKTLILVIISTSLLLDSQLYVKNKMYNSLAQTDSIKFKNITIIQYQPSFKNFLGSDKDYRKCEITSYDLALIDSLFNICINNYNRQQEQAFSDFKRKNPGTVLTKNDFVIKDFKYHKRQYIPYINSKGEKIVWINCFCSVDRNSDDWKNELIFVLDGGNCYFNLKINLNTKKSFDLIVNGDA